MLGLVLGLAAPGIPGLDALPMWWLPWVGFIPLLWWIMGKSKSAYLTVWFVGALVGFGYHLVYESWFLSLHPLNWIGMNDAQSIAVASAAWIVSALIGGALWGTLFMVLHIGLHRYGKSTVSQTVICLIWPLFWAGFLRLASIEPMVVPWANLEYTQADLAWLRASVVPIFGSGFLASLILTHNIVMAKLLREWSPTSSLKRLWVVALIVPALLGLSQWLISPTVARTAAASIPMDIGPLHIHPPALASDPTSSGGDIPNVPDVPGVVVMQGNLSIHTIRHGTLTEEEIESVYLTPLKHRAFAPNTLVVFPEEGIIPGWVSLYSPHLNPMMGKLMDFAQQYQLNIVTGVLAYDPWRGQRTYNAIARIGPRGTVQFYKKRELVPFGETTPHVDAEWLKNTLAQWNIDYGSGFAPGPKNIKPLHLSRTDFDFGGLICFELVDPMLAMQYRAQGADFLLNTSNLGWFHGNAMLEKQFLAIGRFRAAETGLPLIIAANTGISAIIDGYGDVLLQAPSSVYTMLEVPPGYFPIKDLPPQ